MSDFLFRTTYVIYSDPVKVFEALTDPGIISSWGGGLSVVGNIVGETFEMFDGWVHGEIREFSPGKVLAYSWKPEEWDKKTKPSEVKLTFHKHPAGTEIVLHHSGFPDQHEADKHGNGWIDYVFEPLNDYFTG